MSDFRPEYEPWVFDATPKQLARALETQVLALKEALEPFAKVFDRGWGTQLSDNFEMNVCREDLQIIGCRIPVGAFRRARAVFNEEN